MIQQLNQLTSKEGRLSRKGYIWLFAAPLAAVVALTGLALAVAPGLVGGPSAIILVGPWMFLFATADAQNIKRYHDLGNSARIYRLMRPIVMLAPVLALFVQFVLPAHLAMAGDMSSLVQMIGFDMNPTLGTMPTAVILLVIAAILCNTAYLACLPGQRGPNAHGPDPLSGVRLPGSPAQGAAAADPDNDPVKRALADYQARQQAVQRPQARAVSGQGRPAAASSGAASFGRKRT